MKTETDAAFQFSTKARNLAQLQGKLRLGVILDQEILQVSQWRLDRGSCLDRLCERFAGQSIIARSSASGEDSLDASMAGAFDSVANISADDPEAVAAAVESVIESYRARGERYLEGCEVLLQPMVLDVKASGVVFSRDLEKNGPYYLLNYDDQSSRTDTVTAGLDAAHRVVRIARGIDTARLNPMLCAIVAAAQELEAVTGSDAIDIEFAIDVHDVLYVLQVRPLAQTRIISLRSLDARITAEIHHSREFVREKFAAKAHLAGRTTIFGEMPDWNPAEIIGTQPKPLAWSLYRHIIMKSVWREARALMGYHHPFPHQLLVEVAGHPYVDVRCSFNSFLPATLREELREKLVNYYLEELRRHPEFHDKVEFEIVITCLVFDFPKHADRLRAAGFDQEEIREIRQALFLLTDRVVNDSEGVLRRLEAEVSQLGPRFAQILARKDRCGGFPLLIEQLLEDCIRFGTLPFSVFARCAFIGNSFLKSLLYRGAMTQTQYDAYHNSIDTVAGDFVADLDRCKAGELASGTFLRRYGHLRPGTYDICAYTYAERPELYLGVPAVGGHEPAELGQASPAAHPSPGTDFPPESVGAIQSLIAEAGFTFDVRTLTRFIVRSIQLREAVKFEFTRNLSAALSLLVEFGKYHGLSRESLAFVPVEVFLGLANQNISEDWVASTRDLIDRNRKRYDLTCAVNLPDLIFSELDTEVIALQHRRPNFVTQRRVVAPSCRLHPSLSGSLELEGRIVLIENADPGYDWLFSKKIAGLVTKHGGAASHMTIRCAEFGLPAAIGCGEQIFAQLERARSILLDCAERKVGPNAA